ncbi:PD-(D/E)XK nuclease family protein [Flavisolibacter sp. BT320]|nr:PD-(D/E)XK nuclease family protein [Flavisolibacter longurius]
MSHEELDQQCLYEISSISTNENNALRAFSKGIPMLSATIEQLQRKIIFDEQERKERFNIFSCLTRHHLEELHSNFLAYLLNPKETHDCGDMFLRLFLNMVFEEVRQKKHQTFHIDQIEKAEVYREHFIGFSSASDIYGYIDVFVEIDNFVIAIENKIKADEGVRQVERYARYCQSLNKNHVCLFLTVGGHASMQASDEDYIPISYENHIIQWLEMCLAGVKSYPSVFYGINSYRQLLISSILQFSSTKFIMELKNILLKEENRSFLKLLPELDKAKVDVRNHFRTLFFEGVVEGLINSNFKIQTVDRGVQEIKAEKLWDRPYQGILFLDKEYTLSLPCEYKLSFHIEHEWSSLYYGLYIQRVEKGKTAEIKVVLDLPEVKELETAMKRKMKYNLELPTGSWLAWKKFKVLDKDIGFADDSLNYDFATQMDKIVEDFLNEVKSYLSIWAEVSQDRS